MPVKHNIILSSAALLVCLLCGCMLTTATPDVEATVAAALAATQTAQPTSTPTSTPTHTPTLTPTPTHTATPTHTPTTAPTFTPAPTSAPASEETVDVITSTLETGWTLYRMVDEGFEIALPPGWQTFSLNPETMQDALAIVGEQNPAFKDMFSSEMLLRLAAAGIKFYGMNLQADAMAYDLPPSINILKIDLGMALPLDTYIPATLKQLEAVADPEVPITHRRVTLSGVDAEEFKYGMAMTNLLGKPIKGKVVQYLLVDGTTQYAITLASPNELAEGYAAIFEQIGQSFKLFD